jgi:hypothetical protein
MVGAEYHSAWSEKEVEGGDVFELVGAEKECVDVGKKAQ